MWAWREGTAKDETVSTADEPRFALLAVISSFVLAEMSDKMTLATLALASDHDGAACGSARRWAWFWLTVWRLVWAVLLNRRLPQQLLDVLASLLFLIFGLWMLFDSALGLRSVAISVSTMVALAAATAAAAQTLRRRRRTEAPNTGRSPEVV